jgi:3-dehydroquinate synthase
MDAVKLDTRVKRLAQREVLSATKKDKKMDRGQIRFILLHRLGQAYIDHTVSDDEMIKVLNDIMEN